MKPPKIVISVLSGKVRNQLTWSSNSPQSVQTKMGGVTTKTLRTSRAVCVVHTLICFAWDYWIVLLGKGEYIVWMTRQRILLLCGEGSLHEWRRGLSCFVERLGRRGAQAAPVWDAACLVVVVSWHWPAAQDVLQRPEDSTCRAGGDMNTIWFWSNQQCFCFCPQFGRQW